MIIFLTIPFLYYNAPHVFFKPEHIPGQIRKKAVFFRKAFEKKTTADCGCG